MTSPSTYIITGASAGIGLACVRLLASQGANVVLLARRYDQLCAIQASLPNPEHHLSIRCDVSHKADVEAAIAQAVARYGHIDAIICNAGVGLTGPIATLAYADILACFEVNVAGVLHSIQACLPHFQRQGAGQFVVISSVVGMLGLPYNGGYCASKGAVERLCDALRVELIGTPISLSVVRPGTVASEFFHHRLGATGERRRQRTAIAPERVAEVVMHVLRAKSRVAYTRWQDRLALGLAAWFPQISDRILANQIAWHDEAPHDQTA
jgi:NADP-dependent 3-hydroxy acid dehydrogenase YdfG